MNENYNVIDIEQVNSYDKNKCPYEEELVVSVDGTVKRIPITGIRLSAYGYYGTALNSSIEIVDIDRVTVDGGKLFGETELADGAILDFFQEIESGKWRFHHWPNGGTDPGFGTVWERSRLD